MFGMHHLYYFDWWLLARIESLMPQCEEVVLLQGDDIFLDHLPETERKRATELCRDWCLT